VSEDRVVLLSIAGYIVCRR